MIPKRKTFMDNKMMASEWPGIKYAANFIAELEEGSLISVCEYVYEHTHYTVIWYYGDEE